MKKLKVKTCFNPDRVLYDQKVLVCEPSPCFRCNEGVCCESFTQSRDNEASNLPICEDCSLWEALVDYERSYK